MSVGQPLHHSQQQQQQPTQHFGTNHEDGSNGLSPFDKALQSGENLAAFLSPDSNTSPVFDSTPPASTASPFALGAQTHQSGASSNSNNSHSAGHISSNASLAAQHSAAAGTWPAANGTSPDPSQVSPAHHHSHAHHQFGLSIDTSSPHFQQQQQQQQHQIAPNAAQFGAPAGGVTAGGLPKTAPAHSSFNTNDYFDPRPQSHSNNTPLSQPLSASSSYHSAAAGPAAGGGSGGAPAGLGLAPPFSATSTETEMTPAHPHPHSQSQPQQGTNLSSSTSSSSNKPPPPAAQDAASEERARGAFAQLEALLAAVRPAVMDSPNASPLPTPQANLLDQAWKQFGDYFLRAATISPGGPPPQQHQQQQPYRPTASMNGALAGSASELQQASPDESFDSVMSVKGERKVCPLENHFFYPACTMSHA